MKERKVDIKTIKVYAECDCGGSYMATGQMLLTAPPYYVHECDSCGKKEKFLISYPTIEFEEIDPSE